MHEDVQWFIGLIILIAILWWSGGGALKNMTRGYVARTRTTLVQKPRPAPVISQAPIDLNLSPFRGKITIVSVSRASDPNREFVTLRAVKENTAPISLFGLTLGSAVAGTSYTLPLAWILPFPGSGPGLETAALAPGASAYIISGRSPTGFSFETNLCTGYFATKVSFSPPLVRSCPSPTREPLPQPPNQLSDKCYDFLKSVPSCFIPQIPIGFASDGSCQAHIVKNLNYDACVRLHKNEPKFFRGAWHLYLNTSSRLWREKRETLELLDQDGRIISTYSY